MRPTNLYPLLASTFIVLLAIFMSGHTCAQKLDFVFRVDSAKIEQAAQQYLDSKTSSWNRFNKRSLRTSKRFVNKIKRQEQKIVQKLKSTDSTRYQQYLALKGISADSLQQHISDSNSPHKAKFIKGTANSNIDSIKRIGNFLKKNELLQNNLKLPNVESIQNQFSLQQYTQKMLQDRTTAIAKLLEGSTLSGYGKRIANTNKQYQQQVSYWKNILNNPDLAEEEALDYLRGVEGFEESLNNNQSKNPLSGKTSEELEAMGYQTKTAVSQQLQEQFGNQLSGIQQNAAEQLQQYTSQLGGKDLGKLKEVKQSLQENKSIVKETKNNIKQATHQLKQQEGFKNGMRGIPFWHRWDVQYNFQMQRASADKLRPVMLQTGLNVAYKQTEKLSLGLGLDASIGLGSGWQQLKISYEGVVSRVFVDYKMIWGFSMQGGYEKSLRPLNRPYTKVQEAYGNVGNIKTQMGLLQDAAYLGIMKSYRINSKMEGTMLFGYNFLNDKTNIHSPWIVRLGWKF